ncbi:DNA polymerase III subunit gamma/tau [Altererythrobacter sp.]|uniref:DNA polymerase III subunit gamma/tau n=1 Tax=Altererythrobacter sp. TaxID=1872480 RepID=UPI001B1B442F|nr:DNA polymerase III subunit gamma/tau [Altererythrobacter sp.]MBO6609738.1 DNA polymerase III subunit gamma/tau [Altererythrobacter sp.]MBO6641112.1 DNA polymerase III subunit gamma/tau [Altererythrobacter sp.]MBO6708190.1 DNA polymerase III subunit gamma/tau [Altererythrobacter sp.]
MGDSPENTDTPPWETDEQEEAQKPSAAELEAAGQNSMFGDSDPAPEPTAEPAVPAAVPTAASQPYRVLARKYRPQTFSELIGQDAMVRTLGNAIERDRLAHAFLMTGVRGVGKTSTARLIAKALNCVGPDGQGGPTIDPCGQCEPCTAIAEGRHIDVIEMDAASHTGVDDVREIIEQVRYAAVSARYKIYIIDEVHMLTRNAFNALLKTLEEPPAHVKFLFATTEVEKLPVTVLSRTQRFDLRRIPAELLQSHFAMICEQEGVTAENEALHIIAAAAEGSVRDGLSILDQAIAHADMDTGGQVTGAKVRDMLGLADKGAQRRLLGHLLEGDAKALLKAIEEQYALGVEPLALMRALMELTHKITLAQVSGGEPDVPTAEEREALGKFAKRLTPAQLHRLWQLLLKGYDEVRQAPDPLVSAQMALLRVMHAADMPDPGKLSKKLEELAEKGFSPDVSKAGSGGESVASATASASATIDWGDLVQQVDDAGQLRIAQIMRDWIRVIELVPNKLVYSIRDGLGEDPSAELRDCLFRVTGDRWQVERGEGDAAHTLREQDEATKLAKEQEIREHPMVKATFEAFPDAELLSDQRKVAQTGGSKWSR